MHKALRLMAVAAVALLPLVAVPQAQAANCQTGTANDIGVTGNGSTGCDITLSATVISASTLHFDTINTNFGTVLPGSVTFNHNAIVGSFSTSGGTATLSISHGEDPFCDNNLGPWDGVSPGSNGTCGTAAHIGLTKGYALAEEDVAPYTFLDGDNPANRSTTTTRSFSDTVRLEVPSVGALDAVPGVYQQRLTYTLTVA